MLEKHPDNHFPRVHVLPFAAAEATEREIQLSLMQCQLDVLLVVEAETHRLPPLLSPSTGDFADVRQPIGLSVASALKRDEPSVMKCRERIVQFVAIGLIRPRLFFAMLEPERLVDGAFDPIRFRIAIFQDLLRDPFADLISREEA